MKTVKRLIHISARMNTPLGNGCDCDIAGFNFRYSLRITKEVEALNN